MPIPKLYRRPWSIFTGILLLALFVPALTPATGAAPTTQPDTPIDLWWTEEVDTSTFPS